MPGEPRFLSIDDVLRLHALAIEDQGGDPSLRDRGLLESAIAMPQQQFGGEFLHPDIPSQAAAYCFHICKNHPFLDGNKRAATAAMIAFLSDNGWAFDADADTAEPAILRVASSEMSKEDLTAWLKNNCHEKTRMELREFLARIDIHALAEVFHAIANPGHRQEQVATYLEAGRAIPAIPQARIGAVHAEESGDSQTAFTLRQHAIVLTALYRIAEDMGYEW